MDKMNGKSLDITAENIARLKELFPEVFIEGKIDFEKLQLLLGKEIEDGKEKYSFTWKGKADAIRLAQKQSTGTLRPCKEESKNWDTTENLYIEGDNLEVLKLLQASYHNSIKMIYIDPPYNTGHDFVYEDNFADGIENYKKITEQAAKSNPETAGRYHTNWLNMMYPRLKLARVLLKDDGVIFISIDDNEVRNLRIICDEIFGEENFVAMMPRVTKKAGKTTDAIANNHDYLLVYTKSESMKFILQGHDDEGYKFEDEFVDARGKYKLNQTLDYDSLGYSSSLDYEIKLNGKIFYPGNSKEKYEERKNGKYANRDWAWRWSKDLFDYGYKNGFIVIKEYEDYSRIYTKTYQNVTIEKNTKGFEIKEIERTKPLSSLEFIDNAYSNDNAKKNLITIFENSPFDYSKPVALIKALVAFATTKDDIILDFFSGSGTTAHAVMQQNAEDSENRKWILVQLPEAIEERDEAFKAGFKTVCEIGKERIRRAGLMVMQNDGKGGQLKFSKKGGLILEDDELNPTIGMIVKGKEFDNGFKVFKLDSTNLVIWDNTYTEDEEELAKRIKQQSLFYIKDGRQDLDLVAEIMLKNGRPLTDKITEQTIKDVKVYIIENPEYKILICLQSSISLEAVKAMVKDLPTIGTFIFADRCFKDANDVINTREILKKEDRQMRLF